MLRRLLASIKDSRGVAALEFALVVPMMVLIFIGIYQISQVVRVSMKLSNVAVAVADLVAQQDSVTGGLTGSLGNFCKGAQLMMAPFPASAAANSFSLAIVSVTNYSNINSPGGNVKVDWEVDKACPITATAVGSAATTAVTSPVNLLLNTGPPNTTNIAGDTVIMVQVTYSYSSLVSYIAPTIGTQTRTGFARPRANSVITCTAACL
jgi:Flp pilus assembly protein TadG